MFTHSNCLKINLQTIFGDDFDTNLNYFDPSRRLEPSELPVTLNLTPNLPENWKKNYIDC